MFPSGGNDYVLIPQKTALVCANKNWHFIRITKIFSYNSLYIYPLIIEKAPGDKVYLMFLILIYLIYLLLIIFSRNATISWHLLRNVMDVIFMKYEKKS